ncbi:MAG: class II aldolase/adducin family protein [Flavonifractor sp.]|jgi:L-fuculose-phosphate aldolase|nr:class II aldolase/adducin family protein [Flavonifractor sp.]MCI9424657.1 class II aldolase/adducin family protein [Flavonifractor sp.]
MSAYPTDREAKTLLLEAGRRLYERGFVASNDGNMSVLVSAGTLWTTPTGVSKGFMTEDMLVKTDLAGTVLEGTRKPSSELKMHLRVYQENPDLRAAVHAHPPAATSFAIAGLPLDRPILPEAIVQLGTVPVAPYAEPGTQAVPDSIAPFCRDYGGVLLANHGALTWGYDLTQAYYRMETLEYYAQVTINSVFLLGRANALTGEQVERLTEQRQRLDAARREAGNPS